MILRSGCLLTCTASTLISALIYAGNYGISVLFVLQAKQRGDHFPVWGTCLGSELLLQIVAGNRTVLSGCSAQDVMLPLQLLPGEKHTQLRVFLG